MGGEGSRSGTAANSELEDLRFADWGIVAFGTGFSCISGDVGNDFRPVDNRYHELKLRKTDVIIAVAFRTFQKWKYVEATE
jgi:hypothetical protein